MQSLPLLKKCEVKLSKGIGKEIGNFFTKLHLRLEIIHYHFNATVETYFFVKIHFIKYFSSEDDEDGNSDRPAWATKAVMKRAEEIQKRKLIWSKPEEKKVIQLYIAG